MNLAADDPRLIRLDTQCRALGLTQEASVSCLLWAVHLYCGERGRAAVQRLRDESEGDDILYFNFDTFAAMVGVTPDYMLTLYEAGIATFGGRFATGALQ